MPSLGGEEPLPDALLPDDPLPVCVLPPEAPLLQAARSRIAAIISANTAAFLIFFMRFSFQQKDLTPLYHNYGRFARAYASASEIRSCPLPSQPRRWLKTRP